MKIQTPQTTTVIQPRAQAATPDTVTDTRTAGESFQKTNDTAQMAKYAVTGVGGLILAVPCGYAGLAGGALVGGALGSAVGPVASAFSSSGLTGAIGAAWHGAGVLGHAGLVLGGATALVGAFATSAIAGRAVARIMGEPKESHTEKPINWSNWANIGASAVFLTSGIAAGAVGGMVLGSGAGATGQLVSGLMQHGLNAAAVSGLGHAALLGGAIAAPVAAFVGAKGGAALTKFSARRIIDPGTQALKDLKSGATKLAAQQKEKALVAANSSSQLQDLANKYHARGEGFGFGALFGLPFGAPIVGNIVGDMTHSLGWGFAAGAAVPLSLAAACIYYQNKSEKFEKLAKHGA